MRDLQADLEDVEAGTDARLLWGSFVGIDVAKEWLERAIKAEAQVVRLQAERGEAVEDLQGMCEVLNSCAFCIHDLRGTNENWPTIHCNNKDKRKCWQWRGVEVTP